MLSWIGATTSDINEYDELGKISQIIDNGDKYHIQNIAIIPSRENVYDNQKLKDALVAYGALAISVHGARIYALTLFYESVTIRVTVDSAKSSVPFQVLPVNAVSCRSENNSGSLLSSLSTRI